MGVGDGKQVNIPVPSAFRLTEVGTQEGMLAAYWIAVQVLRGK